MMQNAKWIWAEDKIYNDYVQFRHEVSLDKKPVQAVIKVSADTDYVLWINGRFVSCGQYQFVLPKKSYDTIDLANNLMEGRNSICFLVHYQGTSSFQYQAGSAGLIYDLAVDEEHFVSSCNTYCRRDGSYHTGEISRITMQLGYNFAFDNRQTEDWTATCYQTGTDWVPAIENECNYQLYERPVKKLELRDFAQGKLIAQGLFKSSGGSGTIAEEMQTAYLSARHKSNIFTGDGMLKQQNTYLIYDLGCETAGLFQIDIEAQDGTIVDLSYGEHLESMRVRAHVGGRNFANRFIASSGRQKFTHYFTRFAGRYIQLHISTEGATVHSVGLIPTEYPVEQKGSIEFTDTLHKMVYDTSVRTLQLCMHEHYEDCPWREQALYAMDSRNQALFGYYCFGEYRFPLQSFKLLADTPLRSDGFQRLTAPSDFDITIPVFSMMWIVEVYEYLLYSGDYEGTKGFLQQIEKMIYIYTCNMRDGLVPLPNGEKLWHFYEWAEGLSGSLGGETILEGRVDAPYQLFLSFALQSAIKLFQFYKIEKTDFQKALDDMKLAFHRTFYNAEKGLYCTYSINEVQTHYCELVNAMALITNMCPEDKQMRIRSVLADDNSELVKLTLSHSMFKLDALMQEREKYMDYLTEFIEKKWGYMLRFGATSFWETINGAKDFGDAGSLCHGWSAMPVYFYYAYVLGVRPVAPGFAEYTLDPIGKLIKGAKVPTPNGVINII